MARLVVIIGSPHYVPTNDAGEYDHHAVAIATTGSYPPSFLGGPTAFRPPAFPYLLAGVYKIVGVGSAATRWEAGRVAEAILGIIAVGLIYLIALRLWGTRAALVSAVLAAVYPPLLLVGSSLMSEPLFIALTLGAVLASLAYRDTRRARYALLAGLLCGLAGLTRGNGVVVVAPVMFLVWTDRPRFSLAALKIPVIVLCTMVLTLVPWAIRNTVVFGEFVPLGTETGYALAGTYNDAARLDHAYPWLWQAPLAETFALQHADPRLNEADLSNRLTSRVVRYVRAHPGYPFAVAYWNALRMLNLPGPRLERITAHVWGYGRGLATWSVYCFWLAALLAIGGALTLAARRVPPAFWACPIALAVPSLFFLGLTRYRAPADPYLLMLASLGLLAVAGRLKRSRIGV